jgi:hypothetical protein
MKTFLPVLAFIVLGSVGASAQNLTAMTSHSELATMAATSSSGPGHDVTGFVAPSYAPGPGYDKKAITAPPNIHPDLKPRLGGIFVDGAKYGTVMISPTAPLTYGMGENYLSAPSQREDLQHETGPAAHRDTGGFKLFSIEF